MTSPHARTLLSRRFGVVVGPCLATAWLAVVGCGHDGSMAAVRGRVLLDGEPIRGAQYTSVHLTPKAGRMAKGIVADDGSFELYTRQPGDGAMIGPATLAVAATVDEPGYPDEKYPGVRWVIPQSSAVPIPQGWRARLNLGRTFFSSDCRPTEPAASISNDGERINNE